MDKDLKHNGCEWLSAMEIRIAIFEIFFLF